MIFGRTRDRTVAMICYWLLVLSVTAVRGVRIANFMKRVAESRLPPPPAECTKVSAPCRCTEVYPREIVIECHKANLQEVEEAVMSVSSSKMQVLAIDIYNLVVTGSQYEFGDNFFSQHNAQPRALVVQDCKVKKGKHALSFSSDAFRGLEDTMVTLKVDCPMTPQSLDTVKKLRALHVLQLNQIPLPNLARLNFAQLIQLDLRYDDIGDIDDGAFVNTSQLEVLHLGYNNLKTIKMSWFQTLSNLKELTFPHNKISEIDGVFKGLTNLEHLDISHNGLTNVKSGLFEFLENLKLLKLESNRLTDVRADDFVGLENLEILSLHNNDLQTVHNNSMKSLANLKSLYLSRTCQQDSSKSNNVLTLKENAFAGLNRLKMLDMDCTLLFSLQSNLFKHTPELRYLILANTDVLEPLGNETFTHLNSLTHMYLAGFDLELLNDEAIFNPLVSLKELNLVTYTPALFQCRRTVPEWFENFLQVPKNFTIALPNCLPKVFQ